MHLRLCKCTTHIWEPLEVRESDALKLQLQVVVHSYVGAWDQTRSKQSSKLIEPLRHSPVLTQIYFKKNNSVSDLGSLSSSLGIVAHIVTPALERQRHVDLCDLRPTWST